MTSKLKSPRAGSSGDENSSERLSDHQTVVANDTGLDSINIVVQKSDKIVKSARRTFQIIEFFDRVRRPASLKEISEHLDIPVSSGSILLRSLLSMGYLAYDSGVRKFIPTMRVALMGAWIQNQIFPGLDILSIMSHLHERCGHTIMTGYLNGLYVQYIHVLQGVTPVRFYLKPGSSRLAIRSTLGWMLLSLKSDKEIERVWLHGKQHVDADATIGFSDIKKGITQARVNGYAVTRSLGTAGVGVIAMILSSNGPHPPIAIGIGGPNDMIDVERDKLVELLRDTIQHASELRA